MFFRGLCLFVYCLGFWLKEAETNLPCLILWLHYNCLICCYCLYRTLSIFKSRRYMKWKQSKKQTICRPWWPAKSTPKFPSLETKGWGCPGSTEKNITKCQLMVKCLNMKYINIPSGFSTSYFINNMPRVCNLHPIMVIRKHLKQQNWLKMSPCL